MLFTSERPGGVEAQTTPIADSTEVLRQIIARQERREVGYDEAKEVGSSLIQFFQVLAEVSDESEA